MGDRIAVMSNGVLQQVGAPPQLYDHPLNVFVAAFIGSPAMNFITATPDNGTHKLGAVPLALTGRYGRALEERRGTNILVGFRPEDLELTGETGSAAVRIPAKVDVVEYLGHEELLHTQSNGHEVLALVPSNKRVRVGDSVEFAVSAEKLHLFDPETEERVA